MLTGLLPFKVGRYECLVSHTFNEDTLSYKLITKRDWDGAVITRTWQGVDGDHLCIHIQYPETSRRYKAK